MAKLTADDFRFIVAALGEIASEDIAWSEGIKPPTDANDNRLRGKRRAAA